MGNNAIYSPPNPSTYGFKHPQLIRVPKRARRLRGEWIPAILLFNCQLTDKIVIYFHSTSVDIGQIAVQH